MHSGKPVKSLLGECQPGVCSAWASALQGHGCPAALWPVPGHQTRGRKQHTGASGSTLGLRGAVNSAMASQSLWVPTPRPRDHSIHQQVLMRTLPAQPEEVERLGPGSRCEQGITLRPPSVLCYGPPVSAGHGDARNTVPAHRAPPGCRDAGSGENTALSSQQWWGWETASPLSTEGQPGTGCAVSGHSRRG